MIDPELPVQERIAATVRACAAGVPRIWGAELPTRPASGREGGAEALYRNPTGAGYFPVIVVNHKITDSRQPDPADFHPLTSDVGTWNPRPDRSRRVRGQLRDQLRLAHLYRMLGDEGLGAPEPLGGVIGWQLDCLLVHDLSPLLDDYDNRLADRLSVLAGSTPTTPSKMPECRRCPWWTRAPEGGCRQWLHSRRDVSLVAPGARAEVLRDMGLTTIDSLAAWSGPEPETWQHGSFTETVVTARAWLSGAPLVRRFDTVQVTRADVEVDVDLESYGEAGAYLWGTLLDGEYRPFVTWDPLPTEDEARSFAEFWNWLTTIRDRALSAGKTFAAYCYSRNSEDKWLYASARRFAGRPGIPTTAQITEFVESEHWVDMFQAVSEQFLCPHGKGLKVVAPVAGFHWHDPEASGEASMRWYRRAVGWDGPVEPEQRTRLLTYNQDDVRATRTLREWMRPGCSTPQSAEREVPAIADFAELKFPS